ncbi:MAG: ABC transporter ATP-binding protein [Gemmiger sp.]|nr:ABC transporter ATP-binding protein [Gemmiger sp.]
MPKATEREKLLEVEHIKVQFGKKSKPFVAVKDVSFSIYQGETFGLVGESGSGKTTIGRAVIRANPLAAGEIRFAGQRISGRLTKEQDQQVTQDIQMIFQDPMDSLNERAKVGYIVAEGLYAPGRHYTEEQRRELVAKALSDVGLLPEFASRFPHEFSGGQRQRIGIARALILNPKFIVADEPISALDVSIRAQVLNLLAGLQKERGLTYLFIAHDLSVVRFICDRIAVIHRGQIVELAGSEQLFAHPLHPYTQALLSAIPQPDPITERKKKLLVYDPACHDYTTDAPTWQEVEPGHFVYGNTKELDGYRKAVQA